MILTVCFAALLSLAAGQAEYKDPHFASQHEGIVQMFEWKWVDIAKECEQFLAPMGFGGVQVSPIQENIVLKERSWWVRYQPMSYILTTRSGNRSEFANMVARCNNAGVRVYVEAILNHMTGSYGTITGSANSRAETTKRQYPAVPYIQGDFHAVCRVSNYNDSYNVRNCELNDLHDLDQGKPTVREKLVNFMNDAIGLGVAGFYINAAKHMWPGDLKVIYSNLNNLSSQHGFTQGLRPLIYQDVIDSGYEAVSKYEYNGMGLVTESKYGPEISNSFLGHNLLKWFQNWGEAWNFLPSGDSLVYVDNQDTQRSQDQQVLSFKNPRKYKMAVAFMLAHPYGTPRLMSSYGFNDVNQGPPMASQGNIISPDIHADNTCGNGWNCEHRWRQIYNMVRFRCAVQGTQVNNWWDNGSNQIAFCRGNRGFIAINGESVDMKEMIRTCLPPGRYCDVISGNLENGRCTGKVIDVQKNGDAYFEVSASADDGVIAIHVNAKL